MGIVNERNINNLKRIIETRSIKSVYQPIVSLIDGSVFAYEALTRLTDTDVEFNIAQAFEIAKEGNMLWLFEQLCRVQSLEKSVNKPEDTKLFLNVDPNIIHDPLFKEGITKEKLLEYNLNSNEIIFEATEHSAIEDLQTFKKSIEHYNNQGFKIAVDDVGSGYSGLNRICSINPSFLKIDIEIIRGINKDTFKKSLVNSMVEFSKKVGILVIAEGVETKEELDTVIELKIPYAQGYYFKKPSDEFTHLSESQKDEIRHIYSKHAKASYSPSFFGTIDTLCKIHRCVKPDYKLIDLFYEISRNENITEVAVIDEDKTYYGVITRRQIFQKFSGQYGFNLSSRRKVSDILTQDTMVVSAKTPIETVSKLAMERHAEFLYDSVAVVSKHKFLGVVSIRNLLNAAVTIQVKRASQCSPLTGLPGNVVIEQEVDKLIDADDFFAIVYLDIDNFKAYNDTYGFNNGDMIIKDLAQAILDNTVSDDFKGHIGGDDFVIITHRENIEDVVNMIVLQFYKNIKRLYSDTDLKRGYIVSKNRSGFIENFPIATLSVAVITNRNRSFDSVNDFSLTIAETKKKAKRQLGNSIIIV